MKNRPVRKAVTVRPERPGFEPLLDHPGYFINRDGIVCNRWWRELKCDVNENKVFIDKRHYPIGQLVAKQFVPNPMNKKYAVPIDGNYGNFRFDNWAWSNISHGTNGVIAYDKIKEYFNTVVAQYDLPDAKIACNFDIPEWIVSRFRCTIQHMNDHGEIVSFDTLTSNWTPIVYQGVINDDYFINPYGMIRSNITTNILLGTCANNGYVIVSLFHNNDRIFALLHRIMAETYLPNPDNKPVVNHINSVRVDNCVWNLEWVTTKENAIHAANMGRTFVNNKYTDNKIREVCRLLCDRRYSIREISDMTGVHAGVIQSIRRGRLWTRILQEFLPEYKYVLYDNQGDIIGIDDIRTDEVKKLVQQKMKNSVYRIASDD